MSEKSELVILDKSGDLKLMWDSAKESEIEAAKKMFKDMKEKGYLAYTVNKKGDKGEVIREFNESFEKIIMTPQMQGG